VAIYYMNVQIIGRSAGRTSTGAAAYRAGERIVDERTGQAFDYTRRTGEIETEIMAPQGAPEWVQDRSRLWNEVEKAERRGDAQVAREIVVAFPDQLRAEQQWELVRAYVREEFVSKGMVADVAIHRNPNNPHAHIMLTMREVGPEGFSAKKNREWNRSEALERWRASWAEHANLELDRAGREERIDHRRLAEQGVERLPQVHLGPHASALERQGIATEKGDHNRIVAQHNAVVIDLEKATEERKALQAERVAQERFEQRIQTGWLPHQAQAMAQLEAGAGGAALSESALRERYTTSRNQVDSVQTELHQIKQEGQDLGYAREALNDLHEAQAQLRQHMTPIATVKRVFSNSAKEAYRQAQDQVRWKADRVERWGIKGEPNWQQRKAQWEQRQGKVPGLEAKAEMLKGVIGLVEKALQGLSRAAAHEREDQERDLMPQRDDSVLRRLRQNIERNREREGYDRGR
jgi:hypothetical protein